MFELRNFQGQSSLVDINVITETYTFTFLSWAYATTIQVNSLEIIVQRSDGTQTKYTVFPATSNLTVGVDNYGRVSSESVGGESEGSADGEEYDSDGLPDIEYFSEPDYDDCSACYTDEIEL
ncbi:MAG: hypothetical protein ACJAYE_000249 [Candidatus Azotimanducaceae bacterium]